MHPIRKAAVGGVLVLATLGGGALGAFLVNGSASAQTDPTTTAPAAMAPGTPAAPAAPGAAPTDKPDHGRGHGPRRPELASDVAAKVTAAAQAAVPDGTVDRVESAPDGTTYEAHVTKADGTHVIVKIDSTFAVTSTDAAPTGGDGAGRHGGAGCPGMSDPETPATPATPAPPTTPAAPAQDSST